MLHRARALLLPPSAALLLLLTACGSTDAQHRQGPGPGPGPGSGSGGGGSGSGGSAGGGNGSAGSAGAPQPGEPLGPLPPAQTVTTSRFTTADACAFCHAPGGPNPSAMRDAAGRDVSPYTLWRSSMMALSGRDPYMLAALSHEIADNPGARDAIESTCTRCHAPEGAVERAAAGGHLGLDDLTSGLSPEAHLGREGVACTGCHQIQPDNLGDPSSFTGGYVIGDARLIYGPHQAPFAMPMLNNVNYTPTYATHITDSALCGTCHTVITRTLDAQGQPVGPEVPEQVTYHEWLASDYAPGGAREASCQSCHVPRVDADGQPIAAAIANRPPWLDARGFFGRHLFAGNNAYMLELLADNVDWLNAGVPAAELTSSAAVAAAMLRSAAELTLPSVARQGGQLVVQVRVDNQAGHKLPSGYPSRRAWIHLTVRDASGAIVFESGRADATGAILGASGQRLDPAGALLPHRDEITSADQVQIYESVLADAQGHPTHVLLRAVGYAKDNRLLPAGYDPAHPAASYTQPVGVAGDGSFAAGGDTVTYRVPAPAGPLTVEARLLFQTVPPAATDALAGLDTPAALRFRAMTAAKPPAPIVVAQASAAAP